MSEAVGGYLLRLVGETRRHPEVESGLSPRGALALFRAAQARALLAGRDYVSPDDVQALARAVLAHRLVLTTQARYGGISKEDVVSRILEAVPVPA